MSVYAVFIRETTKNEAELAAYMPKAAASMAGHPMTVSPPMAGKRCSKVRMWKASSSSSSLPLKKRKRGTKAPLIATPANIVSAAPTTGR